MIYFEFHKDRQVGKAERCAANNILAPCWVHPGFTLPRASVSYSHLHYMSILLVSLLKANSLSGWLTSLWPLSFTPWPALSTAAAKRDETSLQIFTVSVAGCATLSAVELVMSARVVLDRGNVYSRL